MRCCCWDSCSCSLQISPFHLEVSEVRPLGLLIAMLHDHTSCEFIRYFPCDNLFFNLIIYIFHWRFFSAAFQSFFIINGISLYCKRVWNCRLFVVARNGRCKTAHAVSLGSWTKIKINEAQNPTTQKKKNQKYTKWIWRLWMLEEEARKKRKKRCRTKIKCDGIWKLQNSQKRSNIPSARNSK